MQILIILGALIWGIATASAADEPTRPPSADLAKKCRALAIKAHPPALAGQRSGTAAAERAYFLACLKKGGDMDKPGAVKAP